MLIKAIQHGLRVAEEIVDALLRRFGRSKVGGTLRGGVGAGIPSMMAQLRRRARTNRTGMPRPSSGSIST